MKVVGAFLTYFALPIFGIKLYFWLCQKMRTEEISSPPFLSVFILFFTYGGLLTVVLTSVLWFWSGLASLGVAYLLLLAPPLLIFLTVVLFRKRSLSRYHYWTFIASAVYVGLIGTFWCGVWYVKQKNL